MSRVHTPYMYHVLTVIQWFIWLGGYRSITISCFAVKTRVLVFGSIVSWISLQQSNLREKSKFTGRNCGVGCVHFWTAGDRDILRCPSGGFPAPYKSYKGQCLQGYHKSPAIFEGLDSVRAVTVEGRCSGVRPQEAPGLPRKVFRFFGNVGHRRWDLQVEVFTFRVMLDRPDAIHIHKQH